METNKIEAIARAAHEANRAYCIAIGDTSQLPWDSAAEWQKSSAIAAVSTALSGAGPEAQHQSWCDIKVKDGWKYGPTKNPETKEHPCLVEYSKLPPEQQRKDAIYIAVVKAMAQALEVVP